MPNMVQVAAGNDYSMILYDDGTVVAWGKNDHGELCLGDTRPRSQPTPIQFFIDQGIFITKIEASDGHSIFIDDQGQVYICGKDYGLYASQQEANCDRMGCKI